MNSGISRYLLLIVLFFSSGYLNASPIGVAATVDGHEILESSLQNSIDQYLQEQGTNVGAIRDPRKFQEVRRKVLEVMIGQQLLWRAAQADNLVVDEQTLDRAYREYVAGFEDESMFLLKIRQSGMTESAFRDNLKQKLSAQNWLQATVLKEVSVSDADIDSFYQENQQQMVQPEQVKASHILIQLAADADEAQNTKVRQQLTDIKNQLDEGADFTELAQKHSQDSSASRGGDLGYFQRGQMVPPFEQAAFNLKVGQVSDIVRTAFGYHLIKLEDQIPEKQFEKSEVADRIHQYLWQIESRHAIDAAVAELRENADIEISATN